MWWESVAPGTRLHNAVEEEERRLQRGGKLWEASGGGGGVSRGIMTSHKIFNAPHTLAFLERHSIIDTFMVCPRSCTEGGRSGSGVSIKTTTTPLPPPPPLPPPTWSLFFPSVILAMDLNEWGSSNTAALVGKQ